MLCLTSSYSITDVVHRTAVWSFSAAIVVQGFPSTINVS